MVGILWHIALLVVSQLYHLSLAPKPSMKVAEAGEPGVDRCLINDDDYDDIDNNHDDKDGCDDVLDPTFISY